MLIKTIENRNNDYKPIWFMRQSGRHLKEYNNLRKKHSDFLTFCLSEKSIIEATLIPVKKYDLDAAIIFSDILIVPWLLGQHVTFIKELGPQLSPIEFNNHFLFSQYLETCLRHVHGAGEEVQRKNLIRSNGTLVICPASLMGHWDQEVKSKVRGERLTVFTYHAQGMCLCSFSIIVKKI